MALAILGSYALTGNITGPVALVGGAILGYAMKRYGYSAVAMVIGLLLGGMAEGELLRSYQLGSQSLTILFERPIALGLLAFVVLTVAWPLIARRLKRDRLATPAMPAPAEDP